MPRLAVLDAGTGLTFSGVTTQKCYETSATAAYGAATRLSAFAWTRRKGTLATANPIAILSKGKASASNLSWMLCWLAPGTLRVDTSVAGTTLVTTTTTPSYDAREWHHVGFTYDQSTTTVVIYLDGVAVKTDAAQAASLFASTMPVTIGAASASVGTIGFPMQGAIQEAFVTTQVLTAAQIQAIMQRGALNALPTTGTTSSIWLTGEDVGINAPAGTGTATDVGNATSPMTVTACAVDWYGRIRPRVGYDALRTRSMQAPCVAAAIVTQWNTAGFARAGDIALISYGAQALSSTVTVGKKMYYYGTYDITNGTPVTDGNATDMKTDLTNGVPTTGGGTIIGYDQEGSTNTPAAESNSTTWMQNASRDAHRGTLEFAAIPQFTPNYVVSNHAGFFTSTDTSGNKNTNYAVLQTQSQDWSLDVFASSVFPVLKDLYAAYPTCQIVIQVQHITSNSNKGADHLDLMTCIAQADNYLKSLGSPLGIFGWGFFTSVPAIPAWVATVTALRPAARTASAFTGTATAGGNTTLTDTNANGGSLWKLNQFATTDSLGAVIPWIVYLKTGTGAGQSRTIASNTTTALTVSSAWGTNPDSTTTYRIERPQVMKAGTATAGAATTLTDAGQAWATNQFATWIVYLKSGTGAGQSRAITSNTATVLTVPTWTTNPDSTSVYSIERPPA